MERLILIRYGEIGVKGHNRHVFEEQLASDIRRRLPQARLDAYRGRFFLTVSEEQLSSAILTLKKIPGIFSISPATEVESDMEKIEAAASEIARKWCNDAKSVTFKVEARRADKSFPIKSPDIAAMVGGAMLKACAGLGEPESGAGDALVVDVHNPQRVLEVEVRDKTYLFTERISCLGGMPYGSAGRGLALFSGGIDSPVATYMAARRGIAVEGLHFHSHPFTGPLAMQKVEDLGRVIAGYTHKFKLTKINILEIQKAIKEHCPSEEMTILSRSFMMLIARRIAKQNGCSALITGESIGQVASQTMESITVTDTMADMLIFRPLIATDKIEIIDIARKIGTFDISSLPYEDCCTIFLPKSVVTRPRLEKIEKSLSLLDVEGLVERALETAETMVIRADS